VSLSNSGNILIVVYSDVTAYELKNGKWIKYGSVIKLKNSSVFIKSASLSGDGKRIAVRHQSGQHSVVNVYEKGKGKTDWKMVDKWIRDSEKGYNYSAGAVSLSGNGGLLATKSIVPMGEVTKVFFKSLDAGWVQFGSDFSPTTGPTTEGSIDTVALSDDGMTVATAEIFEYGAKSTVTVWRVPHQCVHRGSKCFKDELMCDNSYCQEKVCSADSNCCGPWGSSCKNMAREICRPCTCEDVKRGRFFFKKVGSKVLTKTCNWLTKQARSKRRKLCKGFTTFGTKKPARLVCPVSCRLAECN